MELSYNTQLEKIALTEYGRGVQEMVEHLKLENDRDKRNILAHTVFKVMVNLNPEIKNQTNYEQTVWDHMHEIANFELDIDNEYPAPEPTAKAEKPEHLGYKDVLSKYRYYGRNLIDMIDGAKDMEDGELKSMYINYIASFMVNSSKNWNEEDLTPTQVVQHLADLSEGKLQIAPDSLDIHIETIRKPNNNRNNNNNRNKGKKKKPFNPKYKKR
ncbi:MAG TPA: hypothetical protein DCX01_09225 [Bacteroidetes bacterium]|mgnify:FL=1|jgi:hypothetical protein|nr:hypothetical protein [Bacteroidota bacterium]|tara:strand:+ start:5597 stop:6238 length:642 start_codon:yes stop_codon:yes gene_type:complete